MSSQLDFQTQGPAEALQPPSCSMSQEAAQQLLQSLQLQVPSSVKALQEKLVEEQSHTSQKERRSDQLQRQLCLVQRMQEQLMVQAAQAAGLKYKEWLAGSSPTQGPRAFANDLAPGTHAGLHSQQAVLPVCFDGDSGGECLGNPGQHSPHNSLKEQLQAVAQEDARCVFVARRLAKLGLDSADKLSQYFMPYGEVKSVHVARAWSQGGKFWRAGSVGFVVMHSAEAVWAIMQGGPAHIVCGVVITVHPFRA